VTVPAAVAEYQTLARAAINDILARGRVPLLVGGSGLYIRAVLEEFEFPGTDPHVRARLEEELAANGTAPLFERLARWDPAAAQSILPSNGRRIVRALEVLELGERTHGAALPAQPTLWREPMTIVGVGVPRDQLVVRLDQRVERMWREGLVDEVRALRERGLERGVTARRAIGYAQALAQLDGDLTEADAIAETQALTRRYARRQVSWFKRYDAVHWIEPGEDAATLADSRA